MAIFQNFYWDIRDSGNNIVEFKKINIFYGRNYSGKTTLSRILRALETGFVSEKFEHPEFSVDLADCGTITQNSLSTHGQTIRVFNKDFVKENLQFVIDAKHNINSFAILGGDNNRLEKDIINLEFELGSEEEETGLYGKLKKATTTFDLANKLYKDADSCLKKKLKDKANSTDTGIKHNKTYGDANYNVVKITKDIKKVLSEKYVPLSKKEVNKFCLLAEEKAKPVISDFDNVNLEFCSLAHKVKEYVEKEISVSEPIQELLDDAVLQAWVRDGRVIHESERATCGFCGSPLPEDLWDRLDKHFNQESEKLQDDINELLNLIELERSKISTLITIKTSDFYSSFSSRIDELKESFEKLRKNYCESLQLLIDKLKQRQADIFKPLKFIEVEDFSHKLNHIQDEYEELRNQSNEFTKSLSVKKSEALTALRLHEVYSFAMDIKYKTEYKNIERLKNEFDGAKRDLKSAQELVNLMKKNIVTLRAQLKDESKGADMVNELLNNFFGHKSLALKAIKNTEGDNNSGYRFEVTRNEKKAYHLSEGECSLIAFCYFIAKLEDIETKGNLPIIWIDDPISSLDANHIFFVYSLINSKIVKTNNFKQLFISTHNLDFLKYLKRLPGALSKNSQYFIIQRNENNSYIKLMPGYLKEYVTEFNFLFHQIYKCAKADGTEDDNHDCYYNFGNNLRKFLEAFLYYKYPNAIEKDDKLARFFGEDLLASSLTDRINNEYSHLAGVFERSITPIDVPEMKTTAEFVLKKIKEKDIDQYNALLISIGEEPEHKVIENEVELVSIPS